MKAVRRLRYMSIFFMLMVAIGIFADGNPVIHSATFLAAIICGCTSDIIEAIVVSAALREEQSK